MKLYTGVGGWGQNGITLPEMTSNEKSLAGAGNLYIYLSEQHSSVKWNVGMDCGLGMWPISPTGAVSWGHSYNCFRNKRWLLVPDSSLKYYGLCTLGLHHGWVEGVGTEMSVCSKGCATRLHKLISTLQELILLFTLIWPDMSLDDSGELGGWTFRDYWMHTAVLQKGCGILHTFTWL